MATVKGASCPTCAGKEKTLFVALVPLKRKDGSTVDPHMYAIGKECYRKQFKQAYPNEKCPI